MTAAASTMTPPTTRLPYRVMAGTWLVISRPAIMATAKKESIRWARASTAPSSPAPGVRPNISLAYGVSQLQNDVSTLL